MNPSLLVLCVLYFFLPEVLILLFYYLLVTFLGICEWTRSWGGRRGRREREGNFRWSSWGSKGDLSNLKNPKNRKLHLFPWNIWNANSTGKKKNTTSFSLQQEAGNPFVEVWMCAQQGEEESGGGRMPHRRCNWLLFLEIPFKSPAPSFEHLSFSSACRVCLQNPELPVFDQCLPQGEMGFCWNCWTKDSVLVCNGTRILLPWAWPWPYDAGRGNACSGRWSHCFPLTLTPTPVPQMFIQASQGTKDQSVWEGLKQLVLVASMVMANG